MILIAIVVHILVKNVQIQMFVPLVKLQILEFLPLIVVAKMDIMKQDLNVQNVMITV